MVWAKNGSITAVSRSGISSMSDSLIAFQPAIEEPSNMVPLVEEVVIDHRQVEGDMLPLAARVGEADVDDI